MEELLKCAKCGGIVFYPRSRLKVAKEPIKKVEVSKIKGEGVPIIGKLPENPGEESHQVVGRMDVLICEICNTMVSGKGGEKDEDRTGS